MNLFRRLLTSGEQRSLGYSLNQYIADMVGINGVKFALMGGQTLTGKTEQIEGDFAGMVRGAYKANGIVFACATARAAIFSSARFQWQQFSSGQPQRLFGDQNLIPLERPWPGGTTQELLARMELHVSFAGNSYVWREPGTVRLRMLRPDWVDILMGSMTDEEIDSADLNAELLGYVYWPGGRHDPKGRKPIVLPAEQVAHYAPYPDPEASYRGVSWLSPVLNDVDGDQAASMHKRLFFENGATPNLIVTFPQGMTPDKFGAIRKAIEEGHEGIQNAYKTLFLMGGADAKVVGSNMQEINFSNTQGAGEVRVAVAAGVPATVLGISEGLAGSSLNAGNFGQARRNFADRTIDPLWKSVAGAMEKLISQPNRGARLVIDTRYVPFLREDQKDAAEILQLQSSAISSLVTAGYDPDSIVAAVGANDITQLDHTGLVSVQLLPPGTVNPQLQAPPQQQALPPRSIVEVLEPLLRDE